MDPFLTFWALQFIIWIVCLFAFVFMGPLEVPEERRDSNGAKIFLLLLTPIFAILFVFAAGSIYIRLGGSLPKLDQGHKMLVVSLIVYAALIYRWIRQDRSNAQ